MDSFDHEKLHVYQTAVRFAAWANALLRAIPAGHGELADQLRRASISIVLNTAEGAGELLPREKARFYRMACRSGHECAAVLDLLVAFGALEPAARLEGRGLLLKIVSMHVVLIKVQMEKARTGTGRGRGTRTGAQPA